MNGLTLNIRMHYELPWWDIPSRRYDFNIMSREFFTQKSVWEDLLSLVESQDIASRFTLTNIPFIPWPRFKELSHRDRISTILLNLVFQITYVNLIYYNIRVRWLIYWSIMYWIGGFSLLWIISSFNCTIFINI